MKMQQFSRPTFLLAPQQGGVAASPIKYREASNDGAASLPCCGPRRGITIRAIAGLSLRIACMIFLVFFTLLGYTQDAPRTVWDGVYNEEQARRGQTVFLEQCSNCHGRDLEGADMTPPLTGGAFTANWDGLTVGDLTDRIRISMPMNSPGTLSRQQTTDVVAYILRFNQFPAGKEELPREQPAQKQILFKARP
jgi:S-disulfanyl-L-cysteine oxidoreductase SoxD